ncbi:MAG: enoyl-CoA hydratase/isomerase family protein [Thermodesulfobacteriota bacterium]
MAPEYRHLIVESEAEIGWVSINRPGDRNSLNTPLMAELHLALEQMEAAGLRAVVFTGAGQEYFIGGADGIEMIQCSPHEAQAFSRRVQALCERLEASPLILLAAINGLCFGGGYEFALACDLRVAAPEARIGLPETKVGIIPGGGGTQRLPRLVGLGLAMEMVLSGRLYKGPQAAAMGLVNRCAPPGQLKEAARELLAEVLRQPQHALSHAKAALRASQRGGLEQGQMAESAEFARCFEQGFFVELMRRQLKEGLLKTTAKLPAGFLD